MSSGEEGKWTGILGKKIKFSENEGGEEYQISGNFKQPCEEKKMAIRKLDVSAFVMLIVGKSIPLKKTLVGPICHHT